MALQDSATNPATKPLDNDAAWARRASVVSLLVSIALLAFKYWGYRISGSQALFSDAMETIVNVVAAGLAILVITVARKPADQDHPYGHGKIEFFSAAFEGGLIAFAATAICVAAVTALVRGAEVTELGLAVGVSTAAGLVNLALGFFLLRFGRKHHSIALEANGHHVLSDFWTSAGVLIGLLLVAITGWQWIDPAAALIVGLWLGFTGIRLVRRSIGGLLDEEDREILSRLAAIVDRERQAGIIQVHHVRVIRSGHFHHIDAHAVVPEFWDVSEAHERTDEFETRVMEKYSHSGELHLHVDPCRQAYCRVCDVADCPIRKHPFEARRQMTVEELTSPEEPQQFRRRK